MAIAFFATFAVTLVIGWFLFAATELALFVAVMVGLQHIRSLKKPGGPLSKVAK
jgi:hypothetical protein